MLGLFTPFFHARIITGASVCSAAIKWARLVRTAQVQGVTWRQVGQGAWRRG